jgi:chromosome segregation ATPase
VSSTQRPSALNTNDADSRRTSAATRLIDGQQSGRRGSYGHSPLHMQSPGGGSASGGSTPVRTAPVVPSMLSKTASASVFPPARTAVPASLAALRSLKLKKLATANTTRSESIDNASLKEQLRDTTEKLEAERKENIQLNERLKALEDLPSQFKELKARVDKQAIVNTNFEKDHDNVTTLRKDVDALDALTKSAHGKDLTQRLRSISDRLDEVDKNEYETHRRCRNLEEYVGAPFHEDFLKDDPTLCEQVMELQTSLKKVQGDQTKLFQQHQSNSGKQQKLSEEFKKEYTQHSASVGRLNSQIEIIRQEATTNSPVQAGQVAGNAASEKLELLEKAVQTLKSSADSNKALVHQITLVQEQLPVLNKDVKELKSALQSQESLVSQISHIQNQLKTKLQEVGSSVQSIQPLVSQVSHIEKQLKVVDDHSNKLAALTTQSTQLGGDLKALNSRFTSLEVAADMDSRQAQLSIESTRTEKSPKRPGLEAHTHNELSQPSSSDQIAVDHTKITDMEGNISALTDFLRVVEIRLQDCTEKLAWFQKNSAHEISKQFDKGVNPIIVRVQELQKKVNENETKLSQLQTDMTYEASTREQEIVDVQNQLTKKADQTIVEEKLNHIRNSFRVLQDQYNNITTDELHGQMVQWFLRTHPSDTASILQQVSSLQHEVRRLQNLSGQSNIANLENLSKRMENLEGAYVPRQDVMTMWTDFVGSYREQLTMVFPLCLVVGQLQAVVRDMYETLPTKNGPRRALVFKHDFIIPTVAEGGDAN